MSQQVVSISTSSKYYWSQLKRMLVEKKIPAIPALFYNIKFISNFKKQSELFNDHFSKQCSLIKSRSTIPSVFTPLTNKSLSSFQLTGNNIKSKINKLDPSKAHGHDIISIHMFKLCVVIFKSFLNQGFFLVEWKKAIVVLAHKKGDHQCVKNYRPASLRF